MNSNFFSNNKRGEWFSGYTTNAYFGPHAYKTNGVVRWNLNNEIAQSLFQPSYTMTGTSPYYFEMQTDKVKNVSEIDLSNTNLVGNLNLSNLKNFGNFFSAMSNLNLTSVTFPDSSEKISTLFFSECDLRNVDLSFLNRLGGAVYFGEFLSYAANYNLTAVTLPNSSEIFSILSFAACDLRTVNLSTLYGLSGNVYFQNNILLSSVTFPSTANRFDNFWFSSCDLRDVNCSTLSGLGGYFEIYNNVNLTALTLPNSSEIFNGFVTSICDLRNLDCSNLSGLGGGFNSSSNANLTALTLPNSSQPFVSFYVNSCDLTNLDCSGLSGLGGNFQIYGNTNLTALTLPSSSQFFSSFDASNCDLRDVDLSTLTNLSGYVLFNDSIFSSNANQNLTALTFPSNSNKFNEINLTYCDLIDLDVSGLSGLGGEFKISNNINLTALTLPSSSEIFTKFYTFGCNLKKLDCSGLSNLGGQFLSSSLILTSITFPNSSQIFTNMDVSFTNIINLTCSSLSGLGGVFYTESNPILTAVTFPNSIEQFTTIEIWNNPSLGYINFWPLSASPSDNVIINLRSNNLSTSIVNHILYDLDQIGWINGTLYLKPILPPDSHPNAAPDGSTGGYNGTASTINLQSNGWNVYTY